MRSGYLTVETHPQHRDVVRLFVSERQPQPPEGHEGGVIRYIGRFHDVVTARMNAHNALRWRLIDIDHASYRSTPVEAIAEVDALELRHQRVWLDPELDGEAQLEARMATLHQRHQLQDRIWQIVGAMAVGFLLFQLLVVI